MKVLVRILQNFKDDTYEAFSEEEIFGILKDVNTRGDYNFIVYKVGLEPNFQVLILEKRNLNFKVKYEDNEVSNYDNFKINSSSEYNFHLNRFLRDDVSSRSFFKSLTVKNKEKEKLKLQQWKISYKERVKQEKRKKNKLMFIGLLTLSLLFYVGNLIYTGEYKFIGQETSVVKAKIYKTSWLHLGKNFYSQTLYFEYIFNGEKFSNHAYIGKKTGMKYEGDSITIKISNRNPKKYIIKSYGD